MESYLLTIKELERMAGKKSIVKVEQLHKWVICTMDNGMRFWLKSF